MRYEPPEPCLCGAEDCKRCRPNGCYSEAEFDEDEGYDEDDPKHPTWLDREEDRAEFFRDLDR